LSNLTIFWLSWPIFSDFDHFLSSLTNVWMHRLTNFQPFWLLQSVTSLWSMNILGPGPCTYSLKAAA
jgi:hypothetical protein